jgi:hypothetical protein
MKKEESNADFSKCRLETNSKFYGTGHHPAPLTECHTQHSKAELKYKSQE